MSTDSNGSLATRAELNAHVKGIDEHFHTLEQAVAELKDAQASVAGNVEKLLVGQKASASALVVRQNLVDGRRFWIAIAATLTAAALSGMAGTALVLLLN